MEIDRRAFIASLGGTAGVALMTPDEKADALEHYMEDRLKEADVIEGVLRETQQQPIRTVADIEAINADLTRPFRSGAGELFVPRNDGAREFDGKLRKLEKMPDQPTLLDFFKYRFSWTGHCLQSATRALKTGMREEITLACLLHDVILSVMHPDHGWWGAQLLEPYVPETTTFAIRYHQPLRFFSRRGLRVRVPGGLRAHLRRRLHTRAVPSAHLRDGPQPQVVRVSAPRDRQRPLLVRSERQGVDRTVHGHYWTPLQAAEGRARV